MSCVRWASVCSIHFPSHRWTRCRGHITNREMYIRLYSNIMIINIYNIYTCIYDSEWNHVRGSLGTTRIYRSQCCVCAYTYIWILCATATARTRLHSMSLSDYAASILLLWCDRHIVQGEGQLDSESCERMNVVHTWNWINEICCCCLIFKFERISLMWRDRRIKLLHNASDVESHPSRKLTSQAWSMETTPNYSRILRAHFLARSNKR